MATGDNWTRSFAKELQKLSKERRVSALKERKVTFVDLCMAVEDTGLSVNPDCLI